MRRLIHRLHVRWQIRVARIELDRLDEHMRRFLKGGVR